MLIFSSKVSGPVAPQNDLSKPASAFVFRLRVGGQHPRYRMGAEAIACHFAIRLDDPSTCIPRPYRSPTRFIFMLQPFTSADFQSDCSSSDSGAAKAPGQGQIRAKAATLRILIVEDDAMLQLGLQAMLEQQPQFAVIGIADNGYRAVEMARQLQPDLILMDVGLPYLDGIAATQQIKAAQPQIKVIMLTSHPMKTHATTAFASGADAYCIKGNSHTGLLTAIAAVRDGATYIDAQIARCIVQQLKPAPATTVGQLSERELAVLKQLVEGKTNREIAASLYLSPNTVKTYVRGVMNKLVVNDRVQVAVIALRHGLV